MKKLFSFSFLPVSSDFGLLLLRIIFGGAMAVLHGWPKLASFNSRFHSFPDPLGVTSEVSYLLTVGSELVAAVMVVLGCYTRFAALSTMITMVVAFFIVHGGVLQGERSGEMAMVYGAAFLAIFVTGAGKYSIDAKIGNP